MRTWLIALNLALLLGGAGPISVAPGASPVTAINGVTARLPAAIAADTWNVISHGLDPTGAADSSPAFTTMVAKMPALGGVIYFPAGTYKFNSAVYVANQMAIKTDAGVVFTGSGRINTDSDTSVMVQQQASGSLQALGSTNATNQWTQYLSMVESTTSTNRVSFEKGALYIAVSQYDNSDVLGSSGTSYFKDLVGVQVQANAPGTATQSRIWGGVFGVTAPSTGNSAIQGIEVDVNNSTGVNAVINTAADVVYKGGINVVSQGTNTIGAAYQVVATGAKARIGLASRTDFIGDYFLAYQTPTYTDAFMVDATGNVRANTLMAFTQPAAYANAGIYLGGNAAGTGAGNIIVQPGGGGGGLNVYQAPSGVLGGTPILAVNSFGDITNTGGARIAAMSQSLTTQGTYVGWNYPASSGATTIVNNPGGGAGGFKVFQATSGGVIGGTPLFAVDQNGNATVQTSLASPAISSSSTLSATGAISGSSTISSSGAMSTSAALYSSGYAYSSPTTGATVTLTNAQPSMAINPAGTLATLTVALPSSPPNGEESVLATTQTITALTITAGVSVYGAASTLSSSAPVTYKYIGAGNYWQRWH